MKYCWEYTNDYLDYRKSIGLDIKNPMYFINILAVIINMRLSSQKI